MREYQFDAEEIEKEYQKYGEDIRNLQDRKWLTSKSHSEIQNVIEKITQRHEQLIQPMQSIAKKHAKAIREYVKKYNLSEKALNIRLYPEKHAPVLFSITEKKGKVVMEYMNKVDLSKMLWQYADQVYTPK